MNNLFSIRDFRAHLKAALDIVQQGGQVIIAEWGKRPIAVVLDYATYLRLSGTEHAPGAPLPSAALAPAAARAAHRSSQVAGQQPDQGAGRSSQVLPPPRIPAGWSN